MTDFTTSKNLTDRCYHPRNDRISLIGIHTMEAPEAGDTAEAVANYFKTVDASAHWCVDNNSRVRVVEDTDGAWTMPPTNNYSLNVELAGYAGQNPKQWADAYSQAALDIAAVCVAEWCVKYNIPIRHLTAAQIAAKEKGIAGHIDVNNVFHGSTHWDPGPDFPWDEFLALVAKHAGTVVVPPTHPPTSRPSCVALQRAVHTPADNLWGTNTDKSFTALIEASNFGGNQFPYGVVFTQHVVGTTEDGVWGPNSNAAHTVTVRLVQEILNGMGFNAGAADGFWGPNTDRAYQAARNACHI